MRSVVAAYLLVLSWSGLAQGATPALEISNAWVRAVPGSTVAAAYFSVHNPGPRTVAILSVSSPAARGAMIHDSNIVNGRATMRPHGQLSLAPGQTLTLAPGGSHVMLTDLVHPLSAGEHVPLILDLGGGTPLTVTATVRPLDAP
ncbi:MAG: copper chaperone PCu(A)C [Proteobacteria bacterium]|nr:copper chaperone PCu(A)C [Pseudomonadota bacterium]